MFIAPLLALSASQPSAPLPARVDDLRAHYDVIAYRLDLAVDPTSKTLSGTVAVEALVIADTLTQLVLDLRPPFEVSAVQEITGPLEATGPLAGTAMTFRREKAQLVCELPSARKKGESFRVAVTYSGKPRSRNAFSGFHWAKTKDGQPWISTSCQDEGSAGWWPCKDSYFHPEDKPERLYVNATAPKGLYAVSNGRLVSRTPNVGGTETFHWVHEYPLETYSVTLNVAPYVVVEQELELEGLEQKLPFVYYVLPEDAEKAAVQFAEVPKMLAIYSRYFGPFPFPKSKFGLVETSFWGMEHSTAVAYGSSFPAWLDEHEGEDPYAAQNELFDYILVHESAHEWWGNAVSAKGWGDFWIHEGFGTYAEAVYLEFSQDAATAQRHLDGFKSSIQKDARLYRGKNKTSGQAYDIALYHKGAWVLHTLRAFVNDDALWWKTLREFNLRHRYKNADTDDFRAVLEEITGRDWKVFFDEWVYGAGSPIVKVLVTTKPKELILHVQVESTAETRFHLPLELAWKDGKQAMSRRFELAPGVNHFVIPTGLKAKEVRVVGIERMLCDAQLQYD